MTILTSAKRLIIALAVVAALITSEATAMAPDSHHIPTVTFLPKEAADPQKDERAIYEVTQYTAGYESTGKRPGDKGYGITSSGVKARVNHTLACPESIPYGTDVYIPELDASYVCEDTGAAITDGYLDIYVDSVKAAKRFGRRKMYVIIDEKGADVE